MHQGLSSAGFAWIQEGRATVGKAVTYRRREKFSPSASMTAAGVLMMVALVAGGCQTMTGRSVGQWVDDRAITARVKARLAAADVVHLTRVHVDTYHGAVYLTGAVATQEVKQRSEEMAAGVSQVRLVVNNLHVVEDGVNALPRTASAAPVAGSGGRSPALPPGITRLEAESGTPSWTRYAGYDAAGHRVATVFALSTGDVRDHGLADLPTHAAVDRMDMYREPGGGRYFVVLWHERRDAGIH